ncbi:SAM-dependent methyltransferase [Aquibium carbonis]|nr:SAM-dependent methyltransferase [Aquibium carbonis]
MRARVIQAAGFEAKFRQEIDPWNYTRSPFEAHKRGILLRAAGDRNYGRGFELACAIGETTKRLAPRCLRLTAQDASPTALREAKRRIGSNDRVLLAAGVLPADMPSGPFDLIVASEILYYLHPNDLRRLLGQMLRATARGGRIVSLHHLRNFDDAAILPRLAQKAARDHFRRHMRLVYRHDEFRFQCVAFAKAG